MKFVLFGRSGVGKSTQEKLLSKAIGIPCVLSTTTRAPREGEIDGVAYRFISMAEFEERLAAGHFVQNTVFKGNRYGALREDVPNDCIFIAEPDGIDSLCESFQDVVRVKLEMPESVRDDRLDVRGSGSTVQDEERFDTYPYDYLVDATGTREEVTQRLVKVYEALVK